MRTPPRWTLGARTTLGLVLALGLLGLIGAYAIRESRQMRVAGDWSRRTLEVLNQLALVSRRMVDAETGQRGYLLTGSTEYLAPFDDANANLPQDLARLRELTADNPTQREHLVEVQALTDAKLAELKQTIMLRASRGLEPSLQLMQTDVGKLTMDKLRAVFRQMELEERGLLELRLAARERRGVRVNLLVVIGSTFAFALVVSCALALNAQGRRRLRALGALEESEERLRVTLRSIGDAVIATDADGRCVFLNPVAEALTGWSDADARGRALPEVFTIVNEETRAAVESPVAKVLREGQIVGLANHTVLIARDGREIAIDDSGAPIRDAASTIMGVVLVFRDVGDRRAMERERERIARMDAAQKEQERSASILRRSEERYRSLVAASSSIVWTAGARGTFDDPQPAWEAYTGQRWHEHRGEGWTRALHENDRARVVDTWRTAQDAGAVLQVEGRVWHAGSRAYRYCRARGVPLFDPSGALREWIGMIDDVHESHEVEVEREELLRIAERAREEAESANRAKDEFLSVLSHELRTPLQAMIAWVGIIRRPQASQVQVARAGEVLLQSIRIQEGLINDLLDVSRIVSGKLTLDMRPVDAAATVAACVDQILPMAQAKGVQLDHTPSAGDVVVVGDPERLQQAVRNVLHNAVKFTPSGGHVTVTTTLVDGMIAIMVQDSGEGIAPEVLPHVFDRFWQADSAKTRRHGGLGLGLAIARYLVEAQGGTIAAESAGRDQGATLTLRMPHAETATAPHHRRDDVDGHQSQTLEDVHVLLVDDDRSTCEALRTVLEQLGAVVTPAASVREALASFDDRLPDVVVSDVGMPEESGYVLMREIRARETTAGRHTPALAMTGFASKEDRDEAHLAGFDDHVAKPIDPDALVARIRLLVHRSSR